MELSPYNTLQEQQLGKPHEAWRILVVCILLNRTHGRQVRPMIDRFFEVWPEPTKALTETEELAVKFLLRPLGFYNRRLETLKRMSRAYVLVKPFHVIDDATAEWARSLPGCGQYAVDSIRIFLHGSLENASSDHWLQLYVDWRKAQ